MVRAPNIIPLLIYTSYAFLGGVALIGTIAHIDRKVEDLQLLGDSVAYPTLKPCRIAAPSLASLLVDLKLYDPQNVLLPRVFTNKTIDTMRYHAIRAMCRKTTNAERVAALLALGDEESETDAICDARLGGVTTQNDDKETWLHGKQRIRKLYTRAHTAFYAHAYRVFVQDETCINTESAAFFASGIHPALYADLLESDSNGAIAQESGGDTSTPCETETQAVELQSQLYRATSLGRVNGNAIESYDYNDMLVRLVLLAAVAEWDAVHNAASCASAMGKTAEDLCKTVYNSTAGTSTNAFTPWPYVPQPQNTETPSGNTTICREWQLMTHTGCGGNINYGNVVEMCGSERNALKVDNAWTGYTDTVASSDANAGAIEHCIRTHTINPSNLDALAGLPDIDANPASGLLFPGGLGWDIGTFNTWYADKRTPDALTSQRVDAVFYSHYRLANELFFTVALTSLAAYWFGRGLTLGVLVAGPMVLGCLRTGNLQPAKSSNKFQAAAFSTVHLVVMVLTPLTMAFAAFAGPFAERIYLRPRCETAETSSFDTSSADASRLWLHTLLLGACFALSLVSELVRELTKPKDKSFLMRIRQQRLSALTKYFTVERATGAAIAGTLMTACATAQILQSIVIGNSASAFLADLENSALGDNLYFDIVTLRILASMQPFAIAALYCRFAAARLVPLSSLFQVVWLSAVLIPLAICGFGFIDTTRRLTAAARAEQSEFTFRAVSFWVGIGSSFAVAATSILSFLQVSGATRAVKKTQEEAAVAAAPPPSILPSTNPFDPVPNFYPPGQQLTATVSPVVSESEPLLDNARVLRSHANRPALFLRQ